MLELCFPMEERVIPLCLWSWLLFVYMQRDCWVFPAFMESLVCLSVLHLVSLLSYWETTVGRERLWLGGSEFSVIQQGLSAELLLLHTERSQLSWFRRLTSMHPEHILGEAFWACPTRKRPSSISQGGPRICYRDDISWLVWECCHVPLDKLEEVTGRGTCGFLCLGCCPRDPPSDSAHTVQ